MSANPAPQSSERVVPLRQPREWWVVRTAEGLKALPYRSNSRTPAIGPFMTRYTAQEKIDELNARERERRQLLRTAVICTAVIAGVTGALMVAP